MRLAWLMLGFSMMGLGILGAFLPVLPTTPFLLVACWAFGKSSPKWAERLRSSKRFGPYLREWEQHRVIPIRAKILACSMMLATQIYLVGFSSAPIIAQWASGVLMLVGASYILTKPSKPSSHDSR